MTSRFGCKGSAINLWSPLQDPFAHHMILLSSGAGLDKVMWPHSRCVGKLLEKKLGLSMVSSNLIDYAYCQLQQLIFKEFQGVLHWGNFSAVIEKKKAVLKTYFTPVAKQQVDLRVCVSTSFQFDRDYLILFRFSFFSLLVLSLPSRPTTTTSWQVTDLNRSWKNKLFTNLYLVCFKLNRQKNCICLFCCALNVQNIKNTFLKLSLTPFCTIQV